MKRTLVQAGAFLSAYELIKLQVVDGVRDFYWTGIEEDGKKVCYPDYEADVLALSRNRFSASVAWLVNSGALTGDQANALEKVHHHRHEIAHELPKILIDPDFEVNASLLIDAALVLRALDVFWGRMSMEIDPHWDDAEVADKDIWGGPSLLMGSLIEVCDLGPDDGTSEPTEPTVAGSAD